MKIAVASDHRGFTVKSMILALLESLGHDGLDLGTDSNDSVDYPDFAAVAAGAVADGTADRGILICGTGVGMAIAANKVPGIRAAQVADRDGARLSREHNDANILTLGARTTSVGGALEIVDAFLGTPFGGGRHQRRVDKIMALEEGRVTPVTSSGPPLVRDDNPKR